MLPPSWMIWPDPRQSLASHSPVTRQSLASQDHRPLKHPFRGAVIYGHVAVWLWLDVAAVLKIHRPISKPAAAVFGSFFELEAL